MRRCLLLAAAILLMVCVRGFADDSPSGLDEFSAMQRADAGDAGHQRIADFIAMGKRYRAAGGYENLLLADTADRIALQRMSSWLLESPGDADTINGILTTMELGMSRSQFTELVHQTLGDPLPSKPATRPIADFDGTFQGAIVRMAAKRPDWSSPRTASLLRRPDPAMLLTRVADTARYQFIALPTLIKYVKNGGGTNPLDNKTGFRKAFDTDQENVSGPGEPGVQVNAQIFMDWYTQAQSPALAGDISLYAQAVDLPPLGGGVFDVEVKPIDDMDRLWDVCGSADGSVWAAVRPQGDKVEVLLNGKTDGVYAGLADLSDNQKFLWSPVGSRVAYTAMVPGGVQLVCGDFRSAIYQFIDTRYIQFSSDGGSLVFVGERDGHEWLVAGGKESGPFDDIKSLCVSRDGHRVACIADHGARTPPQIVVDGIGEQPSADVLANLVLSPDGSRWAFMAQTGGQSSVVIEGRDPVTLNTAGNPLIFSPDGQHLLLDPDSTASLVLDGRVVAKQFNLGEARISFLPGGNFFAVSNDYSTSVFDTDGKHVLDRGAKLLTTTDGRLIFLQAPPSGNRAPNPIPPNAAKRLGRPVSLAFAAHPQYWRFTANNRLVVIDGNSLKIEDQITGPFASIARMTMGFSPDGTHVAVATQRGSAWRFCVDGQETAETFDAVLNVPCYFEGKDATSIRALAVRDGEVVMVQIRPSSRSPHPSEAESAATPILPR